MTGRSTKFTTTVARPAGVKPTIKARSRSQPTREKQRRATWTLKPLTFDELPAAVELARGRLKDNPDFIARQERLGTERALAYKLAVTTGLRRGELASLTISWACRKVVPRLYLGPDAQSATAPRGSHPTFPVVDRLYALDRYKPGQKKEADGDLWLLEISYDEIAPYPPGMVFDPRQRVAFAAELFDEGAAAVDPQQALQALPIASTMNRLSIQPTLIRTPIVIKSPV